MIKHIEAFKKYRPSPSEAINNVYEFPIIEPAIRYIQSTTGFPTKATWLKAIQNWGNLSWPLLNVKNVNNFFPESEETQKGHMRTQRQGVQSTKNHRPAEAQTLDEANPTEEPTQPPILNKKTSLLRSIPPETQCTLTKQGISHTPQADAATIK